MNQSGQATIEMILMSIVVIAIVGLIKQHSSGWLSDLAEGPQAFMVGMMQDSEWMPADKSKDLNPNFKSHQRHGAYLPSGQ